ncbi:MAG: hypothetical protein HOE53_01225 [Candidatus Magasanikbacteria bacterium]|jgi:uridine kinase|nr:hypothetical protein [Candidatus Magasanikbacteria bacterium]
MITLPELIATLTQKANRKSPFVVGVSGLGNAGKSTITKALLKQLPEAYIVHIDDFYKPVKEREGEHHSEQIISTCFDWDRLETDVFDQIAAGKDRLTYDIYDWVRTEIDRCTCIPLSGIIIVEGIYALQDRFLPKYDFTVWIDTPEEERDVRARKRYNDEFYALWKNVWIGQDRRYIHAHRPAERADAIISGHKNI